MARRTITMRQFRYWKARDTALDKCKKFDKLPDEMSEFNYDFLKFLEMQIGDKKYWNFTDIDKGTYCHVQKVGVQGRSISFVARVGSCGESGEIIETSTNQTMMAHGGDLANVVHQRVTISVPKAAQMVVMVVENLSDYSSTLGSALTRLIRDEWNQRLNAWTLDVETVVRADEWLESAEVGAINAVVYQPSRTGDNDSEPIPGGELRAQFLPPKGNAFFSRRILPRVENSRDYAQHLLGLSDPPDKVTVTMTDGVQQRTYNIDGEAFTPAFREIITDHGETALTDEEFLQTARKLTVQLLKEFGEEYSI